MLLRFQKVLEHTEMGYPHLWECQRWKTVPLVISLYPAISDLWFLCSCVYAEGQVQVLHFLAQMCELSRSGNLVQGHSVLLHKDSVLPLSWPGLSIGAWVSCSPTTCFSIAPTSTQDKDHRTLQMGDCRQVTAIVGSQSLCNSYLVR